MIIIYNISIWFYSIAIRVASLFNTKAKQWVNGRKNIFLNISDAIKGNENIVWFHVSSLGEFEQGRPVIEGFKNRYPDYKILLTFFSPSGYEIRKNYKGADYIFYLPIDSKHNAKRFINIIKPKVVFFVKYEFWFHYLSQLKKQNIPTYIFSAIFRKKQLFFKWYGGWYRKMLTFFNKIYVQNQESKDLLAKINITQVEVAGDTRFDRVYALAKNAAPIDLIEQFAKNSFVIIAGSTWEKDEEIIAEYAHKYPDKVKWIIAPHEIHKSHINKIEALFKLPLLKFSDANTQNILQTNILIIDSIGILSSLYRYGKISYIGGGFGKGIHNTLEAVTYGLPVIFGPNYKRFQEACDLINIASGYSISDFHEFETLLNSLLNDKSHRQKAGKSALQYVDSMRGGTEIILSKLFK